MRWVLGIGVCLFAVGYFSDQCFAEDSVTKFSALQKRLRMEANIEQKLQHTGLVFVDCSTINKEELDKQATTSPTYSQWIYNGVYTWTVMPAAGGSCVYLRSPEDRGLTQIEAQSLYVSRTLPLPLDSNTPSDDQSVPPGINERPARQILKSDVGPTRIPSSIDGVQPESTSETGSETKPTEKKN